MFLLMMNDLPSHLFNDTRLFADDTSVIFTHHPTDDVTAVMNAEMERFQDWADTWCIGLNPSKTCCMNITFAANKIIPTPMSNGIPIEVVSFHKHLGLILNNKFDWNDHIEYMSNLVSKRIGVLRSLKYKLNRRSLRTIYISHIRSKLEYCGVVWDNCTAAQEAEIENHQKDAIRIFTGLPIFCRLDRLYKESGLETLVSRRRHHRLTILYKALHNKAPAYLKAILPPFRIDNNSRNQRNHCTFYLTNPRFATYENSFVYRTTNEWNLLDVSARSASSLSCFKRLTRAGPHSPMPTLLETPRYLSVIYTQLKCHCSQLKEDLFHANLIPSPSCECGSSPETLFHFLYDCSFHDVPREHLMYDLDHLGLINLSIPFLFNCDENVPANLIHQIQSCIYKFLVSTRRFS